MRASLIIAAHNENDRLWRTVASCVETSAGLDCEIVIADDASWDDSVEETLRRFPQVRVVRHEGRKGASPTKDLGARHARGEVLIFLDGHTKPEPGAIQRLIEDVERLKGEAIITPTVTGLCVTRWKSSDHQKGHGYSLELERLDCAWLPLSALRPHPHRGRLFYESPALIGCAFAVHRELYDDLRGFDPHMLCWGVEDLDFGLKCWLMGHPILHDPEAVIGHRFQQRFDNFEVPIERLLVNQLRMARKSFTDAVWSDWIERCRRRYPGKLTGHPEGLWARAWDLFGELRPSVEHERAYLLARRVHDEFWFAERFDLPWPRLQTDEVAPIPTATREFSPESEPEPSPTPTDSTHYLDAVDDSFALDESDQSSGNVIIAEDEVDDQGHDTYDGIPIANPAGFIATLLTPPQHGSVALGPDGHFTYTRDPGYTGSDSFTYELRGPNDELDQATVNIHDTGTDDHEPEFTGDHTVTVPENTALNTILLTVAATDQDGGTLTYSIIGGNNDGLFQIGETDGVIRLVNPLDYETAQRHTLTVKAMDTTGLSATTNVIINVTDVNEPPVFRAQIWIFDYDGAHPEVGTVTATDPENDDLSYSSDDAGPTFRVESDGTIYREEEGTLEFPHTYELTVKVDDGHNPEVTANVHIVTPVIQYVTAIGDDYSFTTSDASPFVVTRSVLSNDQWSAASGLHARLVSGPSQGTLILNEDGTFSYEPIPGASYIDSFVYEAWFDPQGGLADPSVSQATATLNIYYAEDEYLLEAIDDTYDETIRESDGVFRGNVLDNDTLGGVPFMPGGTTTVRLVPATGPKHGVLVLNDNGQFEYTPNAGYLGEDWFVYRLTDNGQSDEASVWITVPNSPPVILDQEFSIASGYRGQIARVVAYDPNPRQRLTFSLNTTTPHADWFELSADGVLRTARNEAVRVDQATTVFLTVTVTDDGNPNLSATATITVQITKPAVEISLKSVDFRSNYAIAPDPGQGAAYPSVEFDIETPASADPIPVWYEAGDSVRATVTFTTSSDVRRQIIVRPQWPQANVNDAQPMTIQAGPSTASRTISLVLNSSQVNYVPNFDIRFEASFDDGNSWSLIGTSRNVLYVSKTFASTRPSMPYRTTLHIATKYAAGATTAQSSFNHIWNYFSTTPLAVTTWNGNSLQYNHGANVRETAVALLTDHVATCNGWSLFFDDVLEVLGLDSALGLWRAEIYPNEILQPIGGLPLTIDLLIKNIEWGAPESPANPLLHPAGFQYRERGTNPVNGFETFVDGLPGQNNSRPSKYFAMHAVMVGPNGRIYDPAYGAEFASLTDGTHQSWRLWSTLRM